MNKKVKIYSYITVILFTFSLAGIMILYIVTPNKEFSENENRVLEKMPKLSFSSIKTKRFMEKFEDYITDQFPFRDFWIKVMSSSEKLINKKENNGIYLGKEDYLIQKFSKPDEALLEENINAINKYIQNNEKLNHSILIVPTATGILKDKLPYGAPTYDENIVLDKILHRLSPLVVDVRSSFNDINNEITKGSKDEPIYYKTDHHWTTKGAYYGYKEFAKKNGFKVPSIKSYQVEKFTDSFYGTLYSSSGFRDIKGDSIELYKGDTKYTVKYADEKGIKASLYHMEVAKEKDKYKVFFGGNHSLITIDTENNSKRKLVVIKDSYANCFIPFLLKDYSSIYVVDPRYYRENISDLIKNEAVTDSLILYNVKSFSEDLNIKNIAR